jgi:hypothetical protein
MELCDLSEHKKTKEAYTAIVAGNIALLSKQFFDIDNDEMNAVSNKVTSILQDENKDKIQIRTSILCYLLDLQQDALTAQLSDINTRAKAMNDAIQRITNDVFAIPRY